MPHPAAVLSLWLFAAAPQATLGEPYENPRLFLRFRPPAGWQLVNPGIRGNEPIEFWKSGEYGPRIHVQSFPFELSEEWDLERVQQELSAALRREFPDLKVVSEKKLTHHGSPAVQVTATLTLGNTFYHVIQRCLLARGRIYILTCAAFEGDLISELPVFRAVLDSVEILGSIAGSEEEAETQRLLPRRAYGMMIVALLALGVVLRQLSIRRLEALGRWPLPKE